MMSSKNTFFLLYLFLFIFDITVNGYDKTFECSLANTPSYILEANTVTLFQTPEFPKNINNSVFSSSCNANFTASAGDTNDPNTNIWILLLNGVISEIQFYETHNASNELMKQRYNSNFDIVNFTTSSNGLSVKAFSYESEPAWAAFQAIVVSYPQNFQGCPLENKTFDFSTDTNSVIPVTPTFLLPDVELSYKRCNWQFRTSSNQQLKVAVRKMDLSDQDISLILSNENGIKHIFSDNDLDQVFYFEGRNFDFEYEFNHANFSNTGFLIFVSAVEKSNTYTFNGCQPPSVNMTTKITTYSNIDYVNSYPKYQKCVNTLTIDPNHEARLSVLEYDYEGISDKLTLNHGQNSSKIITWKTLNQPIYYKLTSDISGGQLTFNSDGNTQGAGYRAILESYECQCSDSKFVFQCEYTTHLWPMNEIFPYCNNMKCNYTIFPNSTCSDTYFSLSVENSLRKSIDYLIIYDNENILENITADSGNSDFYFAPNSTLTVQFVSGSSSSPITDEDKSWNIKVKPIATPKFSKIILNETNSKYVKWLADMGQNDNALIVCTLAGTLEIFIPHLVHFYDLQFFYLYDSEDLNNFVGSLNSIAESSSSTNVTDLISQKSTSGCFTIYLGSDFPFGNDYSVLFRNVEDSNKNCQDSNTVFQIPPPSMSDFNVTVQSTASGSCEMIILTSDYSSTVLSRIWISNISVSDPEGEYSVYSGENGKKLFSFKGSDASKWINFGVYAPALSIIAPPSSSLTISMSGAYQALELINIPSNGIQSGIMASPSYSGFMQTFGLQSIYESNGSTNFTTLFQMKEIYGDANPILENEGKNTTLTKDKVFTAKNSFTLFYEEKDPSKNGFMIEYIIHSGAQQPGDTSTSLSTSIPSSTTKTGTSFSTTSVSETIRPKTTTKDVISTSSVIPEIKTSTPTTSESTYPTSTVEVMSSTTSVIPDIKTSTSIPTTIKIVSTTTEKVPTITSTTLLTTVLTTPMASTETTNTQKTSTTSSSKTTTPKPMIITTSIPDSTDITTQESTTPPSTTSPLSSSTNQTTVSAKSSPKSTTTLPSISTSTSTVTTPKNSAKSLVFEFSIVLFSTFIFVLFH